MHRADYKLEMGASTKLGALIEEENMGLGLGRNSSSSSLLSTNQQRRFSTSGVYDDVLNISPRLSYHNPTICLERKDHGSLRFPEKSLERRHTFSMASNETSIPKPTAELVNEIAALELEVVQLERHLLSLYRSTFERYVSNSPTVTNHASRSLSRCQTGSPMQDFKFQIAHQQAHTVDSSYLDVTTKESHSNEEGDKRTVNHRRSLNSCPHHPKMDTKICDASPTESARNDSLKTTSCQRNHHSLADHLGASIIDHVPDTHSRLSEDIVRCISAVYCKLGSPPTQGIDLLATSTPSASSSSTFSPQDPGDCWSPRCHNEGSASPRLSEKNKHGSYSSIVEVPKICVDGDKFDYASKMLGNFRSLIRRLDTIDPRKMEYGEQLAFWINIHNALVMHAFLAYGLHQNHMKSTSSIMKAAYNIGGHSVNACIIQRAILGCQLHRSALWLRTLFTPALKYLTGNVRHPYALDRPEPLVHFALCLGAYSDPAVRIYTTKGIHRELKLAKAEFIRANVWVQKETRIILPKILYYYAKDASLEMSGVMEMICGCMPEEQERVIQKCLRRKGEKCVEWSAYKSDFRYLVHRDLAN